MGSEGQAVGVKGNSGMHQPAASLVKVTPVHLPNIHQLLGIATAGQVTGNTLSPAAAACAVLCCPVFCCIVPCCAVLCCVR
jgi:hypothetical protein